MRTTNFCSSRLLTVLSLMWWAKVHHLVYTFCWSHFLFHRFSPYFSPSSRHQLLLSVVHTPQCMSVCQSHCECRANTHTCVCVWAFEGKRGSERSCLRFIYRSRFSWRSRCLEKKSGWKQKKDPWGEETPSFSSWDSEPRIGSSFVLLPLISFFYFPSVLLISSSHAHILPYMLVFFAGLNLFSFPIHEEIRGETGDTNSSSESCCTSPYINSDRKVLFYNSSSRLFTVRIAILHFKNASLLSREKWCPFFCHRKKAKGSRNVCSADTTAPSVFQWAKYDTCFYWKRKYSVPCSVSFTRSAHLTMCVFASASRHQRRYAKVDRQYVPVT